MGGSYSHSPDSRRHCGPSTDLAPRTNECAISIIVGTVNIIAITSTLYNNFPCPCTAYPRLFT